MKKIAIIIACALTLLLCSCKAGKDDFSMVEAVPEKECSFVFKSADLSTDKLTLCIEAQTDFENAKFEITAGSEKTEKTTDKLSKGESLTFETAGKTKLTGDFTVECKCGNEVESFEFKNGFPQLSKSNIDVVVAAMTSTEKAAICILRPDSRSDNMAGETYPVQRLGIPSIALCDGPSGLRLAHQTVGYPTLMTLAQSWDSALFSQVGKRSGENCVSFGVDILLAPGVNIQKNTLGGRNFEYISEDPLLSGMHGAAYVNGLQSEGVGASVKHYCANSQEVSRNTTSSNVRERALREIYLRSFDYLFENSDPYSVMTSYNSVNGRIVANSDDLVKNVLRTEFGFGGIVETDWGAQADISKMFNSGESMYTGLTSANCEKEAAKLKSSIEKKLDEEVVNARVAEILGTIVKCNKFTNDYAGRTGTIDNIVDYLDFDRKAISQSVVLLKNDGVLPTKKGTVAVFGNGSYCTRTGGLGSSDVTVSDKISVFEGIEGSELSTDKNVTELYAYVKSDHEEIEVSEEAAAKSADNAKFAIFTISRTSEEGGDASDGEGGFILSQKEFNSLKNIADKFHAKNKKVLVIINTGNPIECESWKDMADAILFVGYGGQEAGNGIADVITGKVNPSGKLACTWPKKISDTPGDDYFPGTYENTDFYEDIYVGYRYYETFDIPVTFSFGYGLSYTSFAYSDFSAEKTDDGIKLSVKVKNTGKTAGREVVQFYMTVPDGENEHPAKELCGFAKTKTLKKGQSETVTVMVNDSILKTYSTAGSEWFIEKGDYTFMVGSSVSDIKDSKKITLDRKSVAKVTPITAADIEVLSKSTGKLYNDVGEDLAYNKPVFASICSDPKEFAPENANDGDRTTRWSPEGGPEKKYWWYVDLGADYDLSLMKVFWRSNTDHKYAVLVSSDAAHWEKVGTYDYTKNNIIDLTGHKARYVKIEAIKTAFFGINEVQIFGK